MEREIEKQRERAQKVLDQKKVGLDKQMQKAENDVKQAMNKFVDEKKEAMSKKVDEKKDEVKKQAKQGIDDGIEGLSKWLKTSKISDPNQQVLQKHQPTFYGQNKYLALNKR